MYAHSPSPETPYFQKTKRTQAILNILLNDTPPFPKEMGTRMQPVCIQVGGGGGGGLLGDYVP